MNKGFETRCYSNQTGEKIIGGTYAQIVGDQSAAQGSDDAGESKAKHRFDKIHPGSAANETQTGQSLSGANDNIHHSGEQMYQKSGHGIRVKQGSKNPRMMNTAFLVGRQDKETAYVPSTLIFFRVVDTWKGLKLVAAVVLLTAEIVLGIALWLPKQAAAIICFRPTTFQILGSLSLLFVVPTKQYSRRLRMSFR